MNRKLKYEVLLPLALVVLVTACQQDKMENSTITDSHSVTASIVETSSISSRMADDETSTSFGIDDVIRIGWAGVPTPYQYTYTGTNALFAPQREEDKGLWAALTANASSDIDVYAWYGHEPDMSVIPAAGNTISIQTNQNKDDGYMKSLYLSAHQQVSRFANSLDFKFKHLVAHLQIDIKSEDGTITQDDILSSTVEIKEIHHQGTIATETDGSNDWKLTAKDVTTATLEMMKLNSSWSVENPFDISHQCYLIPQTLTSANQIVITLGSGKVFTCSPNLEMKAGERVTLTVRLKSGEGYEIIPTVSIFKDAYVSTYSGNRILSAMSEEVNGKTTYYLKVYDKQSDGSWHSSQVYEDEEGTVVFPAGQGDFFKTNYVAQVDMYGDYGVVGYGSSSVRDGTFFIKKSKNTGKWYVVCGPLKDAGYAVAINQHFLLSGLDEYEEPYAYIIDDNGEITNTTGTKVANAGFKLNLAENGILVTHKGVFQMSIVDGKPVATNLNVTRLRRNKMATDGYKVIANIDNGDADKNALIYNLKEQKYEDFTERMVAGDGRPVAIYDRYALIGRNDVALVLYYFNDDNKWQPIGDKINGATDPQSFLKLAQKYNPELKSVTSLKGSNVFMKGTRALVSSDGVTYFIEYIDQMVKDWLDAQSSATTVN